MRKIIISPDGTTITIEGTPAEFAELDRAPQTPPALPTYEHCMIKDFMAQNPGGGVCMISCPCSRCSPRSISVSAGSNLPYMVTNQYSWWWDGLVVG